MSLKILRNPAICPCTEPNFQCIPYREDPAGVFMSLVRYLKKIALSVFSYLPSILKITLYRVLGAQIGKNVELGPGSYILPFDGDFKKIRIGEGVIIDDDVHILAKYLKIGEQSQIKDATRIWGQSTFSLGPGCYIDQMCHFDLRRDIALGNNVVVAGGSWFYTHMVFQSVLDGAPFTFGAIKIGNRAYLGANAFVLPGITIGPDAIVGARAVVTRDVRPDAVVVGNPAREIRQTSDRRTNLGPFEKAHLVKGILEHFMEVYDRNVKPLNEEYNTGCLFRYGRYLVYYHPEITDVTQITKLTAHYQKPAIIISLWISEGVMDYCTQHTIAWFDLGSVRRSSPENTKLCRMIKQFFSDYGIRFSH